MTIQIYWQLDVAAEPGRGEPSARRDRQTFARDVRTPAIDRHAYYTGIARAAQLTGFDGLFLPHRESADDAQVVAAVVARAAPRLALIPEFPASAGSAVYAAKRAVSFQRLASGRLGWAIAPDADAATRAQGADHVAEADLIDRAEEFLTVARGVHAGHPFTFKGRFFEVLGGGFEAPLADIPFPRVFLQGHSEAALALSARQADVHLFDAAPIDTIREAIETLDRLALKEGRSVAFGIIAEVTARETSEDLPADSPGIAGTYDEVADRLAELAAAGVDHFILSATPSLEEAYRIGEFVVPRLRARTGLRAAA